MFKKNIKEYNWFKIEKDVWELNKLKSDSLNNTINLLKLHLNLNHKMDKASTSAIYSHNFILSNPSRVTNFKNIYIYIYRYSKPTLLHSGWIISVLEQNKVESHPLKK